MNDHWRLAVRCAAWIAALAVPTGLVVLYLYGHAHAGAFGYGVGTGILSLVSTALTVSLLVGRSMAGAMMVGAASFGARYGFAAGALGVPAYLGLWPVGAMLGGFAGVYLAQNVVLLPGIMRTVGNMSARRNAGRPAGEGVERRAEA